MSPDEFRDSMIFDLVLADVQRERSRQSDARHLGVSDLGLCKEQTRRMLNGDPYTDVPDRLPAILGTAIHKGVAEARVAANPALIVDAVVVVTLPSGLVIEGHLDELDPDEPSVTDVKTKTEGGVALVAKTGSSDQDRFQRHLYGLGVIQDSRWPHITPDNLTVRNIYLDRSGRTATPHVEQEPYDPQVVKEADEWFADVKYALDNGEEASKDKPVSWCRSFCPHFSACRADDQPTAYYEDFDVLAAAVAFHESSETKREAERIRQGAKEVLEAAEVNGVAGAVKVRRSFTNGSEGRVGYYTFHTELLG